MLYYCKLHARGCNEVLGYKPYVGLVHGHDKSACCRSMHGKSTCCLELEFDKGAFSKEAANCVLTLHSILKSRR